MDKESMPGDFFELKIDMVAYRLFKKITGWARIVAVIGMVIVLTTVLFYILAVSRPGIGIERVSLINTLADLSSYLFFNLLLLRFSVVMRRGLQAMDAAQVESGINVLYLYFKMFVLLMLALVVLSSLTGFYYNL